MPENTDDEMHRNQKRERGKANILYGALWFVGGAVVTALTYAAASSSGFFIAARGAILLGTIQFLWGLCQYSFAGRDKATMVADDKPLSAESLQKDKLSKPDIPEEFWAKALAEYEGERRPGLWARVFSEAGGNEASAKAKYLQLRAEQLAVELRQRRLVETRSEELEQKEGISGNTHRRSSHALNIAVVCGILLLSVWSYTDWVQKRSKEQPAARDTSETRKDNLEGVAVNVPTDFSQAALEAQRQKAIEQLVERETLRQFNLDKDKVLAVGRSDGNDGTSFTIVPPRDLFVKAAREFMATLEAEGMRGAVAALGKCYSIAESLKGGELSKLKAHREIEWVDFEGKSVNLRVKADVFRLVQN